ncbi:MAG TPA: glycosyltransferase family 39 protein [Gaiellaceae bacterium]|nr:glycosyltransferase family 39 protein [Gaiellaceae bacterium]
MAQPPATQTRKPRARPVPQAAGPAPAPNRPRELDIGERTFRIGVAACTTAVAAFLLARLTAWPPHEDETLALFLGRDSLPGMLDTVLGQRGGAPLHFFFAWIVAHLGGGLVALRLLSAAFAVASVPVVALLCARLAGRAAALAATILVSASWMLLFHGVYGRMYSLFLLTSTLSYLAFVNAVAHGGRRRWALWAIAVLAAVATHPYGALVLGSQVLFVLARARTREALVAVAAVAVAGTPFWYTDLVLAGRFEVSVGTGGAKLDGPLPVAEYLVHVAGDFTAGYLIALVAVLALAAVGARSLWVRSRGAAVLAGLVLAVPAVALTATQFGESTSPESRHLVFALPFFAALVGTGLLALARRRLAVVVAVLAALVAAEVAWGWQKTPPLYEGEPSARVEARQAASVWLAATGRPDDVLFGYEAVYLGAWERSDRFSQTVVPRADANLALQALRSAPRLGRGVWVFDASDTNNFVPRMSVPLRYPKPADDFEARVFGPFLVIRSRGATKTPRRFLEQSRSVEEVGRSLYMGDADVNLVTVERALARL